MDHRYYALSFDGALGSGEALIMLEHGMITGPKEQRARTTGVYDLAESGDTLDLRLALRVPATGGAKTNGRTRVADWPIMIRASLPVEALDCEVTVETSTGAARFWFRRIWDPLFD